MLFLVPLRATGEVDGTQLSYAPNRIRTSGRQSLEGQMGFSVLSSEADRHLWTRVVGPEAEAFVLDEVGQVFASRR